MTHTAESSLLYFIAIGIVVWAVITRPMGMFGVSVFFPAAALLGIVADYSVWRSRRRTASDDAAVSS
jgi:hypothetical protein